MFDNSRNYHFKAIFNGFVFDYVCITKYLFLQKRQKNGAAIIKAGTIIGMNTVDLNERNNYTGSRITRNFKCGTFDSR